MVFGRRRVVFLCSPDAIHEAFHKRADVFSGRPKTFTTELLTQSNGVLMGSGQSWVDTRRFSLSTLKDFGMGKVRLEDKINLAIEPLIEHLESNTGQQIDPAMEIIQTVAHVIGHIIFGPIYDRDNPSTKECLGHMSSISKNLHRLNLSAHAPILISLPGDLLRVKPTRASLKIIMNYINNLIQEHKKTFDVNSVRDFVDAFLVRIDSAAKNGDSESTFTDTQLVQTVADLYAAGLDTTASSLRWAFLFMAVYPDIQTKIHKELDSIHGHSPVYADRAHLPYVEATLMEVQRVGVVPSALPHIATEDVEFRGYHIPKNTIIIGFIWGVMHDPRFWDDPDKFDPLRFLDEDGKVNTKNSAYIPFCLGKRQCVGEALAKMELFLIFTAVMKKFQVRFPPGVKPPKLHASPGITAPPAHYKVIFSLR